jgi:hypothetical protein
MRSTTSVKSSFVYASHNDPGFAKHHRKALALHTQIYILLSCT